MDISKTEKVKDIYEESANALHRAFLTPIASVFDAMAVEMLYGSESALLGNKNSTPVVRGSSITLNFNVFWFVIGILALCVGFSSIVIALQQLISTGNTNPYLAGGATLSILTIIHLRVRTKELRKKIAQFLYEGRASLVLMAKMLCTYHNELPCVSAHITELQKSSVELAVGARPSDKALIKLAIMLLHLHRVKHRPALDEQSFQTLYCGEKSDG